MSSAPRPIADQAVRERAVTDFTHNLCVTAGAGCGKTSLLVERVLFAMLARGMSLERIVAITFTEKAAAEMRSRVQAALARVAVALSVTGELNAAAEAAEGEARRTLARLAALTPAVDVALLRTRVAAAIDAEPAMSTLHSFALRLLARHPVEANLPADLTMDLGDGFRRHSQRHVPARVEALLADERKAGPDSRPVTRTLERLKLATLATLARAAAWLGDDVPAKPDDPLAPLRAPLATLLDELTTLRGRVPPPTKRNALFEQWDALLEGLRGVSDARPNAALPPAFTPTLLATLDKDLSKAQLHGVDDATATTLRERLRTAHNLLNALREVDERFAADVVEAARTLGKALAASFAREGFLPADGALARAAALLAGEPAVRRGESAAFDLLLVDEFQDTDPLQCEIVLWLGEQAGDERARRLEEIVLAPGRLFLVGDPKQSIYRFRGADLEMFARARRTLLAQGGVELALTTNFRSRPEILDAVNRLFAPWIKPADDFEPGYIALVASRAAATDAPPAVELWSVAAEPNAAGKVTAPMRRRAEGRAIAAEIAEMHARGVRYGGIALLLRSLGDLGRYVEPLRDRAIPHVVAGGRTFVQRSEVGELASLLLAIADPEDEVASLGALRSTLGAVADADLYEAGATHGTLRWKALVDSPIASVARAAKEFARLAGLARNLPAADAIERVVEAGLLLPLSAVARDGEQRIANLRKLAQQVAARCEETRLPLALALRDLLATHQSVNAEAERSLADEDIEAVRILTIHRAKGLEYDVVFVADLARDEDHATRGVDELHRLATPMGPRAALSLPSLDLLNVAAIARRDREERHAAAESKRLFYVACTRARERLLLVSSAAPDCRAPWIEPLAALTASVPARPIREPPRLFADRAATGSGSEELAAAARRFEIAVTAARAPARHLARPSDGEFELERDASNEERPGAPPFATEPTLARAIGIACHAALAQSGPGVAPTTSAIATAASYAAADTGLDVEAIARATTELLNAAPARTLQASLARAIVKAVELPLMLARDGVVWRGSADLLFEEAGEFVVADWKSDRVGDLDLLAARHRPQLAIYRDAVAAALSLARPPRMELLLLRDGRRLLL